MAPEQKHPSVLLLSFSEIASDPRLLRQIRWLTPAGCRITAMGYGPVPGGVAEFVAARPPSKSRWSVFRTAVLSGATLHQTLYWTRERKRLRALLENRRFDAVVANELAALPLAAAVAGSAPILWDAHEYSPREFEENYFWSTFMQPHIVHLLGACKPRIAAMSTVCEGIAREYRSQFGLEAAVISNAGPFYDLSPRPPAQPGRIRMVHHGVAMRQRRLDEMIRLVDRLDDRFTLDLMLVPGSRGYLEELRGLATPRARVVDPVAPEAIVPALHERGYDLGLYLLPPANFNCLHALPNKFFEFLQARLAVAVGPSPEMAALTRRFDCGLVAESFEPGALAAALNAITPEQLAGWKRGAHTAARECNSEKNGDIFRGLLQPLLAGAGNT